MEIFEGQNNNLILYDATPFDQASLRFALEFQKSSKEFENEQKVVVLDLTNVPLTQQKHYINLSKEYSSQQFYIFQNEDVPEDLNKLSKKSILFKGDKQSKIGNYFLSIKNRKHKTWMEFDLNQIETNIHQLKNCLPEETMALAMVKASSYGTGDTRIPHFLQQIGLQYMGVAFVDEGVILRENGITLPIFVINTEINSFEEIVAYKLEPAIFSFRQLTSLCGFLKKEGITQFPIHLATETGMNRLGFNLEEMPTVVDFIKKTPEISLKGVYSHLADADNEDPTYTLQQISKFERFKRTFEEAFEHPIIFHLLNSEGIGKFGKKAGYQMARLGIGIYGYITTSKEIGLVPSIKWFTTISQIKTVQKGETIGYSRTFKASKDMRVATLLVGYADGFSRKLSNGNGYVNIKGKNCPVVGNVCMDMIMVDVTNVDCKEGNRAEIIGKHISLEEFAQNTETIPHEAMTRIDKRVAKVYLYSKQDV